MLLEAAIYLAIPTLAIELILMVYVYSLHPQSWRNRAFALFMLVLALNSSARIVLHTTQVPAFAVGAAWLNAVTSFMSGPLQWIVAILVFAPPTLSKRWWAPPLLALLLLPLPFFLIDAITGSHLIFDFSAAWQQGDFVPMQDYVVEWLGTTLYSANVLFLNMAVGALLLVLLLLHRNMKRSLRRAGILLLVGSVVTGLVTNQLRQIVPTISGVIDPLLVALITGWVITRYHVFTPVELGLYRGLDRSQVGLIVFDTDGRTLEINAAACRMLSDTAATQPCVRSLQDVVAKISARAVEPELVTGLPQNTSPQKGQSHQVEVILRPAAGDTAVHPQHLLLQFEPIYHNNGRHLGSMCTIQDLTEERQVQAQLAKTNAALQDQLQFIALLNDITHAANGTLEFYDLQQLLADRLGELFQADGCYVTLWDEARQMALPGASYGPLRQKYRLIKVDPDEPTVTGSVLQEERPLFVANTGDSPYISPRIAAMFPERSVLGLPLIVGTEKLGAVLISYLTPHSLDEAEISRGEQVAAQIALALAKTKLLHAEREGRKLAEAIAQLSSTLRASTTLPEILNATLQKGVEFVRGSGGAILLRQSDQRTFTVHATLPPVSAPLAEEHSVAQERVQQIIDSKSLYESDSLLPELDLPFPQHPLTQASRVTALPLRTQAEVMGILLLCHTPRSAMLYEEVSDLLVALAEIAGSAIQRTLALTSLEAQVQQRTQELEAANERLAELDKLKSKLINDISHELRTPITNIRLYLDLLVRGKPENHPRYLEILQEKAESLIRLTEDILHVSQLTLFQSRAVFKPTNLNQIAALAFDQCYPRARGRDLQISLHRYEALPPVAAEPDLLLQALLKLLDNALKYTPMGSIEIRLSTDAARKFAYIAISDTGIGIKAPDLPYIFDRLYRGESIGQLNIPGSGLGLTIAAEIAAMHRGYIEVESDGRSGSTFRLTFPAIPEEKA